MPESSIMQPPPVPPLNDVARLCLSAGLLLLQTGASGRMVHEAIKAIAFALGCNSVEVFCQHAAILVTIRRGTDSVMQMSKAGEHGVNLRRDEAVRKIIHELAAGKLDCAEAQMAIEQVPATAAKYPLWLVCLSAGVACGAFGRLLGADWQSFLPTLLGSAGGQWLRHTLFHRRHNIFVTAGIVSFVAAFVARLCGSVHVPVATVAAVLLLVPGVAVLNAQVDVLEGKPNLAAARALRVFYLLTFMALGLALAQALVLPRP
jgi:uncharacterized membrane protein YjjP (DUF1212 family)